MIVLSQAAFAQDASLDAEGATEGEIIVEARRRDETVQEVPLVVNPVTADQIDRLNLRDFKDIVSVVPGLQMANNANGSGTTSSLRGVNYDVNASGNNGTIEYYLNDAPMAAAANALFQAMFDIGQIEVLRGPQGTLRGRSTPSGSITIAYRKPDLQEVGGYLTGTVNDLHGHNLNGAIGIPLIKDMLAVRISGVAERGRGNNVRSPNNSTTPFTQTQSGRVMARFQPADFLDFEGMYQTVDLQSRQFDHVASFGLFFPGAPAGPVLIRPQDRINLNDDFRDNASQFDIFTWKGSASFAGQQLIYVGSLSKSDVRSYTPSDPNNFFGRTNYGQTVQTNGENKSHEIRLQNVERVAGMFDYVAGYFRQTLTGVVDLAQKTPVRLPDAFGGGLAQIVSTPIHRTSASKEESFFGNVSFFLGDATEIAGGVRRIRFKSEAALSVSGNFVPAAQEDFKFSHTVYSASLRHRFSDALVAYARFGTSWRPGINVVGDFSLQRSALENSFLILPPETSKSYEVGLKAELLDRRLKLNVAAYQQDFKNYPYRSSSGVNYVNFSMVNGAIVPQIDNFNFVAPVPVRVRGFEADFTFDANDRISLSGNLAYADGKIRNGLVACNDLDNDGIPDLTTTAPTLAQLQASVGADNVAGCNVTQRSFNGSQWSGNIRAEYRQPISGRVDGFARALFSWNGSALGDPANAFDDYGAYGLLNLYLGVRGPDGAWELQLFGKNITNDKTVLTVGNGPFQTTYQQLRVTGVQNGQPTFASSSTSFSGPYANVSMVPRREFGATLRIAFGSR